MKTCALDGRPSLPVLPTSLKYPPHRASNTYVDNLRDVLLINSNTKGQISKYNSELGCSQAEGINNPFFLLKCVLGLEL